MKMHADSTDHLKHPVAEIARPDVAIIHDHSTVSQALEDIRSHGIGEKIVYFYVVDSEQRLVGVIPTRRLLTAPLDQTISAVMIPRVVTIPESATILEAHEILARNKLLALPVVDRERRVKGVVDVGMFATSEFDALDREKTEELFELIGLRVSRVRDALPHRMFGFRFPWLLATIASGTICAILASAFDLTLSKSLVLAFFLTLVLGLGESVSMQTMTVTIHGLRLMQPNLASYLRGLRGEVATAFLLGCSCALIVGAIVWFWQKSPIPASAIAASILLVILTAAFLGFTIPVILHALKLDLKIAAGPLTLALADICTILIYFGMATFLLM